MRSAAAIICSMYVHLTPALALSFEAVESAARVHEHEGDPVIARFMDSGRLLP